MVRRLLAKGHACVVHDAQAAAAEALRREGAVAAASLAEVLSAMRHEFGGHLEPQG